jgi:hypothetical protein
MEQASIGDRIVTSGYGRTERWPHMAGTIVRVFEDYGSVTVVWDGSWVEDEMELDEIAFEVA